MTVRISHITVHCRDPFTLSEFWRRALGWTDEDADPNRPGDDSCVLFAPDGPDRLLFVQDEWDERPGRIHLDLEPVATERDEEVRRLLELGATVAADRVRPDGRGWITMLDPGGNEFCVLRHRRHRDADGSL